MIAMKPLKRSQNGIGAIFLMPLAWAGMTETEVMLSTTATTEGSEPSPSLARTWLT
jgi:hypothetical protein